MAEYYLVQDGWRPVKAWLPSSASSPCSSLGAGDCVQPRSPVSRRDPGSRGGRARTSTASRWIWASTSGKKPVLLEFWATWCELCEALLPTVRAAQAEFGDRVEFFGVNVAVNQTPERVRKYIADDQPPFRTLYDAEGVSTRAYAAPTTSYIVIMDRAGKVAYTGTGGKSGLRGRAPRRRHPLTNPSFGKTVAMRFVQSPLPPSSFV